MAISSETIIVNGTSTITRMEVLTIDWIKSGLSKTAAKLPKPNLAKSYRGLVIHLKNCPKAKLPPPGKYWKS